MIDVHPLAMHLPDMTADEFDRLKASIANIGLQVPPVRYQGKLLDGRHRLRACDELGLPVLYWKDFEGTEDQARLVVEALNLERRHSTPEQLSEARDSLIRQMRAHGMSIRSIIRSARVGQKTVYKAISGVSADTPDAQPEGDEDGRGRPEGDGGDAGCDSGDGRHEADQGGAEVAPRPAREVDPGHADSPAGSGHTDDRPEPTPAPRVTGRDGKTYPAKRPEVKPASKPAPSKPAPPTDAAWAEFMRQLEAAVLFVDGINPHQIPEGIESWQLAKTLESTARRIMSKATALRQAAT